MDILLLSVATKNTIIEEPGLSSIGGYMISKGHRIKILQIINPFDNFDEIKDFSPRLVGVSTYDHVFKRQIEFIKLLKKILPQALVCLGGYTASYHGTSIMNTFEFIDFIIKGEGELPFEQLVRAIEKNEGFESVTNLLYRKNGIIIENKKTSYIKDLNMLPFSDRTHINDHNVNLIQLSTSRGCTSNCTFCLSSDFWRCQDGNRLYRKMNAKRVVDEIEFIHTKYNKSNFIFNDNCYEDPNNDLSRQLEIAEEIIKRDLRIYYSVYYKARFYKYVTDDFMALLQRSGLISIFLGVESGDDEDLLLYNKHCNLADCNDALDYFNHFEDLFINIGFINLNPYTTIDKLYKNTDFLKKHFFAYDITIFNSRFMPFKGTKLFEIIEKEKLLTGSIYEEGYDFIYKVPNIMKFDMHLNKQVEIMNQKYKIRYLCRVFPITLLQLKKDAKNERDDYIINILSDVINQYTNTLKELNREIAAWIYALLELLINGWNENNAELISIDYMTNHNILILYEQLQQKMNRLYVKLIHKDNSYHKYFYRG